MFAIVSQSLGLTDDGADDVADGGGNELADGCEPKSKLELPSIVRVKKARRLVGAIVQFSQILWLKFIAYSSVQRFLFCYRCGILSDQLA